MSAQDLPLSQLSGSNGATVTAVLLADTSGRVLFASETPVRSRGAADWVGRDWRELFPGYERVRIDSRPVETFFFSRPDGNGGGYRVYRWPATPVSGTGDGHFIFVEAVDDAAATEELIYRERMIALGQIAGGVAHEVNNPLTTISGWLQILLAETERDDKIRAPLKLMSEETTRIAALIHHLLNFGRRTPFAMQPVRLGSLLADVLALVEYQIRNENIVLTTGFDPDVPLVTGDTNQLKQVFLNIITNARQAMPKGGSLSIRTSAAPDGWAEALISDTGCGMTPEVAQRVFEPFFTTKSENGGSGIGLFLCRNIVKEHKGTLTVSSRPGEGSTFIIRLPAAPQDRIVTANRPAEEVTQP